MIVLQYLHVVEIGITVVVVVVIMVATTQMSAYCGLGIFQSVF